MKHARHSGSFMAFVLALGLVVAGCGGGGGGSGNGGDGMMPDPPVTEPDPPVTEPDPPVTEPEPEPTEPTPEQNEARMLQEAQSAALSAYSAAVSAVAGVASISEYDIDSYTSAQAAVERARAANAAAQAATTSAAAQAAQRRAEAARADAVRLAGMVRTAQREQMANAVAEAEAMSKEAAIEGVMQGLPPASLEGPGNYSVEIERKSSAAAKITIEDPGYPAANDPKFVLRGGKYERKIGSEVETIVIHTDIDPPSRIAFRERYDAQMTADYDADTTGDDTLVVDNNADGEKVASSRFPSSMLDMARTFATDDTDTDVNERERERFSGTFDGAPGTYRCGNAARAGGDPCTANRDANGNLVLTGTWHFTPRAGATLAEDDNDYLHYGFWIEKTVEGGETTYDAVRTFAGSFLSAYSDATSAPAGSATYSGGAAGVYVHRPLRSDGSTGNPTTGSFTADVNLTAYFGTPTSIAADDHNSVEGEITNFRLGNRSEPTWKVKLESDANSISGSAFTGSTTGMTGELEGDAKTWNGTFHGPATDEDNDAVRPAVAVGHFNADFVNGVAAGAFGARKTSEDPLP